MFNVGTKELLVILLVVLLLFGAKRIPEVARALGKGVGDFRDALSGIERELTGEPPIRRPPRRLSPGNGTDAGIESTVPRSRAVPGVPPPVPPVGATPECPVRPESSDGGETEPGETTETPRNPGPDATDDKRELAG